MSTESKAGRGFEPHGLPGYRIFQDPKWSGSPHGDWFYTRPADVPRTFEFDEATNDHTRPVFNDWATGPRKTAKGAVAEAHKHDRWVKDRLAICGRATGESS